MLARVGGDELAIVMPRCALDAAQARGVHGGQDARRAAGRGGRAHPATPSAGVAHSHPDARDVESLHAAADAALYRAKRARRDRAAR